MRVWGRLNWGSKLLLLLLAFATTPVVTISYLMYGKFERTYFASTLQQLEGQAGTKAQGVEQFTSTRVRQVERIALLVAPNFEGLTRQARAHEAGGELPDPPADPDAAAAADAGSASDGTSDLHEVPPTGDDAVGPAPGPPTAPPRAPPRPAEPGDDRPEVSSPSPHKDLRRTLGLLLWDQKDYEELLVIDQEGVVRLSTFAGHEGRSAAGIEYFHNGQRTTFVQPVFLSPITERLTMVVATPIRDRSQRVIGVLAARLNLETFFRLLGDQTGLGETGETVVARQLESDVLFMAPTRHDPEAASKRRVEIGAAEAVPLQDAARGQSGSGVARDYRGEQVLAAWRHIPSLAWGLVVKMDRAEAWTAMTQLRREFSVVLLVVVLGVLVASMLVARALVAPLRELKDATDRISKGDLDVKLRMRSGDEIGQLADSFERMIAAIEFFRGGPETEQDEILPDEVEARPSEAADEPDAD